VEARATPEGDLRESGLESCLSDKQAGALGTISKIFQVLVVIRYLYKTG